MTTDRVRWTIADLDLLPDNGNRYEVIDGELFVTRAPHWGHQRAIAKLSRAIDEWSESTGLGETVSNPGVIFSPEDAVIPDVVWISKERLALLLDEAGHLTGAPELAVEILSAGSENERRDREAKLKLYAVRGVQEYWIVNWRSQQIEIYRRQNATLVLIATLLGSDRLSSPLLPNFEYSIADLIN